MRLGAYECVMTPGGRAAEIYGKDVISERHRHRYEFNPEYLERFEQEGLKPGGVSPDGSLVEMVEYRDHPWFIGCQFHPEFKSRPMDPHPLFVSYIGACVEYSRAKERQSGEMPEKVRRLRAGDTQVGEARGEAPD